MSKLRLDRNALKAARKRAGYKSQEFAALCGIPVGTYFTYESGARFPSMNRLQTIAEKLNVDVTEISTNGYCGVNADKAAILKERIDIDTAYLKIKRIQLYDRNVKLLAKKIGVATSSYYELERGKTKPTREVARRICTVLNISFNRLVKCD